MRGGTRVFGLSLMLATTATLALPDPVWQTLGAIGVGSYSEWGGV
jgi:hypothetical protein